MYTYWLKLMVLTAENETEIAAIKPSVIWVTQAFIFDVVISHRAKWMHEAYLTDRVTEQHVIRNNNINVVMCKIRNIFVYRRRMQKYSKLVHINISTIAFVCRRTHFSKAWNDTYEPISRNWQLSRWWTSSFSTYGKLHEQSPSLRHNPTWRCWYGNSTKLSCVSR